MIKIDSSKCLKCGVCIRVCPAGVFSGAAGQMPSISASAAELCRECGHCAAACRAEAVSVASLDPSKYTPVPQNIISAEQFADLVYSRRSVREFENELLTEAEIRKLLELTRFAPTAKNMQQLSWVVVSGKEKVHELAALVAEVFVQREDLAPVAAAFAAGRDPIARNAPHVALVYGPAALSWGALDGATAIADIELGAKASGLGTCWGGFIAIGAGMNKKINAFLGLDETQKIFGAVMLGHTKTKYYKVPPKKPLDLKIIS